MQPETIEFSSADGVFVKMMHIREANVAVPQHAHTYDHLSLLARGSCRMAKDGLDMGVFRAPCALEIQAGVKHLFVSLEPDTIIYCIHNVSRSGEVEIAEEHQFRKAG
jgi:hypothetical protein